MFYEYILRRRGIEPGSAEAARVWEEYVDICAEEIGVEREEIVPNASFIEDLRMD